MKISLIAGLMKNNDICHQIKQIEYYLERKKQSDLLVFGECYLNGFDGLSWEYNEDLQRAIPLSGKIIKHVANLALSYNTALSFGFIERCENCIYSSNIVVDCCGRFVNLYRRRSPGWKTANATHFYSEGSTFSVFELMGKRISTAICGDLWNEEYVSELKQYPLDILLWPLYIDYTSTEWKNNEKKQYLARTKGFSYKVLMVNSFLTGENGASGGCYMFENGSISKALPLGESGALDLNI